MIEGLKGLNICVLGGDFREIELIQRFIAEGAQVKVVGYPPLNELKKAFVETSVFQGIIGTSVIIVGMGGLDIGGKVRTLDPKVNIVPTEEFLELIPPGVPLIVGAARPRLREFAAKHNVNLIEVTEDDEMAIRNSIPTAEGALQIAMEEMPITIHKCNAFVVGFGRVGETMARVLYSLGANTFVCARNLAQLAKADVNGYSTYHLSSLAVALRNADVVFNTVPAIVLTERVLKCMKPDSLIIDLASSPGGTNFEAAKNLNIKAILALGLPGKVAPKTAGKILADSVPQLIRRELSRLS